MSSRRCVALFVVHGIGEQRQNWAHKFVTRVERRLARLDGDIQLIPAISWWAPVTSGPETELLGRVRGALAGDWLPRLRWWLAAWGPLRDITVKFGGDVVAYQAPERLDSGPPAVYSAIHERLNLELQQIVSGAVATHQSLPRQPIPLVAVAHSLGSVIFSDFTYDLQQRPGPLRDFPGHYRLALRALFTFGSPLALYALRYPGRRLDRPIALAPGGRWVNVLYRSDVIGHELRDLSDQYGAAVQEDWVLSPRWWPPLMYLTPLAHLAYWNDRRVIARVARTLAQVAEPVVG